MTAMPAAVAIVKPARARRQHDAIERVDGRELIDADGQVSAPWRVISILDAMQRRGAISEEMEAAGQTFSRQFRLAHLDQLRASSMTRAIGHSNDQAFRNSDGAKRAVMGAIDQLGGLGRSPPASCVWHVLGLEWSLRRWSSEFRSGSTGEASGILVAALAVLAGEDCS